MTGGVFLVRACCPEHGLSFTATSNRPDVVPIVIPLTGRTTDQMKGALGMFVELSAAEWDWDWQFMACLLRPDFDLDAVLRLNTQVAELASWWKVERDRLNTARHFAPALARVVDRRDGMTGEIDWPEVRRRAETEEDGCGAAIVLLSAFAQGAKLGQRDGADATPEGLEPGAIPVVVEWPR